jgi:hypothetical protein
MTEQTVICPDCRGGGFWTFMWKQRFGEKLNPLPCPTCGGKGRVGSPNRRLPLKDRRAEMHPCLKMVARLAACPRIVPLIEADGRLFDALRNESR